MDLGLFVFLAIFAYSSLIIKSQTSSIFIALPILALGVIACAILGTYAVASESIILETSVITGNNSTNTSYYENGTIISISQYNATGFETHPVLNITESWGVAFFVMFHFLLAFLNVVNALYFIGDKIKTQNQFRH